MNTAAPAPRRPDPSVDILGWVQSLPPLDLSLPESAPAHQAAAASPTASASGWTVLTFPDRDHPGRYKINARSGCRILSVDRLTADDVTGFDPEARWTATPLRVRR